MTGTSCGMPTSGSLSICCSRVTICGTPGSATVRVRLDARQILLERRRIVRDDVLDGSRP